MPDICLIRGQKTVNIFKMLKIKKEKKIQSIISISSTQKKCFKNKGDINTVDILKYMP